MGSVSYIAFSIQYVSVLVSHLRYKMSWWEVIEKSDSRAVSQNIGRGKTHRCELLKKKNICAGFVNVFVVTGRLQHNSLVLYI